MTDATATAQPGLAALTARVRHDLECLDYPAKPWVRQHHHDGAHVYDVAIIGGGQCGLAVAFGLKREKVDNILILDENKAGEEGPWVTYARMVTLRTPKYLTGPDLGVASLTFRAFWEAQFGEEAWAELGKVPREEWMRYLCWFRETLHLPVQNESCVTLVEPLQPGLFRLHLAAAAPIIARKVVMATGIQGGGEWQIPDVFKKLPRRLYAHTSSRIDYAPYTGKSIGILGGGASAFDNAQYVLGHGIAEAHVFMRRDKIPSINPIRFMENAGFLRHFADLGDTAKYECMDFFLNHSQPPTNDTFTRASAYPGFHLHLGEPWLKAEAAGDGVRVTTPKGSYEFAFVLASTGLLTNVALRPELSAVSAEIAHWRDRYEEPAGAKRSRLIDDHPYLGPSFEFLPLTPESEDRLHGLFVFNYSALVSLGLSAAALSGMKFAVPRLVAGVTRQLFRDDEEQILGDFLAYAEEEFVQ